jgi:hypothetical protein
MAIFGNNTSRPVHWLDTGLTEARRVGRIHSEQGAGLATGFLFDGGLISAAYQSLPLFLTCNHCVGGSTQASGIPWSSGAVVFQQMQSDPQVRGEAAFLQLLAESPPSELNYSLLLLDRWPGKVADLRMAPRSPQAELHDKVFIISYPLGGGLAVSLDDNLTVNEPPERSHQKSGIYYRAPTQGGSSGAPVFNEHWEIVAMHVGGATHIGANFGVAISAVVDDARRRLEGFAVPGKIRELIQQQETAASPKILRESRAYFSVFISYRHADAAFARRLFNALESRGARAWLDEKRMVAGEFIDQAIQKGIGSSDKFVLCCSKASLENSWWVDSEIGQIFEKERQLSQAAGRKLSVVIPITLDDYLTNEWKGAKAPELRARYALDFRNWQDERGFEESFNALLSALRADGVEGGVAKGE